MTDLEIITKFVAKTKEGTIVWKRTLKSTGDPRLNISYICDFVENEYVELAPTKYTDYSTFTPRYSYRLSFFNSSKYCYKSINSKNGTDEYYALETLFKTIEDKIDDLDNKLEEFFK